MPNFVARDVAADGLALLSAGTSAGTLMTKLGVPYAGIILCMQPANER